MLFLCHADGRRQVQDRRTFGAQGRTLEIGRQVSVAPVGGAALRVADFRQDDEAGQVAIRRTESVVYPCTETGIAAKAIATVHLIHCGRMVHAVDGAASEEAEIVCDLGEVRPVVRHVRTALTRLDELKGTLDVVTLAGFHGRLLLTVAGELLKVQLF